MPYVSQEERNQLDPAIHLLLKAIKWPGGPYVNDPRRLAGKLTYAITRLMLGTLPPDYRYIDLRDTLGTIEAAKLEFYRKKVVPYEDEKALENGDVYQAH